MLAWIFFCNNNNKSWLKLLWIVLTSVGFGLIGSAWRIDYCQQQLHKFIGSHWSAAVDSATIWCYQCCRIEAWFSFVCILHSIITWKWWGIGWWEIIAVACNFTGDDIWWFHLVFINLAGISIIDNYFCYIPIIFSSQGCSFTVTIISCNEDESGKAATTVGWCCDCL